MKRSLSISALVALLLGLAIGIPTGHVGVGLLAGAVGALIASAFHIVGDHGNRGLRRGR